jgi:peptide/nickel transport system permease protein
MKRINWMLLIGGLIIGFIGIIAFFPGLFTNINPYGASYFKTAVLTGNKFVISGAPFPPSAGYIFGSDELGRDIYSMIIYGTRLTMSLGLFVVLGRFLLAIPIGIMAGFGNGIFKTIINQFSIVFSAIPGLIISIIVLRMNFFTNMYKKESILAFVIVLTIVGFAKLAQIINERVQEILSREFIKGETAIGKKVFKIALENVIPHLCSELTILFFMEFAVVLAIIMQLGVFDVFVGNLRMVSDSNTNSLSFMHVTFEPEWASMLGTAIYNIISSPWTLIAPVIAFFISIFGLNIFGEGLRNVLQKKDSLFIPKIRRSLSPELSDFKLSNFNIFKGRFKVITIIIFAGIIYITVIKISNLNYNFNSKSITGLKNYSNIVIGNNESEAMAKNISEEFKKMGFKPLTNKGFITPYKIKDEYYCYSGDLLIKGIKNINKFNLGEDFVPESFGNYDFSGQVFDASDLDLFSYKDYKIFNDKVILLNGNLYSEEALIYFADRIMKNSKARGILLLTKKGKELPSVIGDKVSEYPILWITENISKKVLAEKNINIISSIKTKKLNNIGRNVIGILPGTDKRLKDKVIMLGFSYNFIKNSNINGNDKIKFEYEMLKKLSSVKRDRSIIVAFWDGTLNDDCNGAAYYSNHTLIQAADVELYLDLTKINSGTINSLLFSSELSPITRYFAWSFSHDLKTELLKKVDVENYNKIRPVSEILESTPNIDEIMYTSGTMPIVYVGTSENINSKGIPLDNIGSIIFKTIQKAKY